MWAKNKIVDYVYYAFCQHTENIITNYLEYMDAPVHKITNVPLIPIVCNAFLYAGKTQIGDFSVFLERASTFFSALKQFGVKKSWPLRKTPRHGRLQYVFCPHIKTTSRTIRISR
jgi:hypothetical protein